MIAALTILALASMGPQLFSRGNPLAGIVFVPRFTASMGPQLFSRGNTRTARKTIRLSDCFNGATAFQPWKCAFACRGDTVGKCFNGATAFQPWKYLKERYLKLGYSRFNGATAFQPWKCVVLQSGSSVKALLQWGHSFSAVEIVFRHRNSKWREFASMGPQLFSRGNMAGGHDTEHEQNRFNGATAFQPWKSS